MKLSRNLDVEHLPVLTVSFPLSHAYNYSTGCQECLLTTCCPRAILLPMRHELSDPTPRTDPPDDDPEGIEASEWQHDCEDDLCYQCVECGHAGRGWVCQFTCEHRRDLA